MDSPLQTTPEPGLESFTQARENDGASRRIFLIAAGAILILLGAMWLVFRGAPKKTGGPPPYAANIKLSDLKMSAAENFVGATVSYVDGTVTNAGAQTVNQIDVEVLFKDELGQVVDDQPVQLKILRTNGPYPEAVDLRMAPLAPGQSQPFRLTFESISSQWNHSYPEIKISDVGVAK